jgi:serine protease
MRKIAFVTLLSTALGCGASLAAETPQLRADWRGHYVPGQLVVQFGETMDEASVAGLLRETGTRELGRSRFSRGLHVVSLPAGHSVEAAAARFRGLPGVAYAEPNYLRRLSFTPNDPDFGLQWNFRLIGAPRAWDIQQGQRDVTVAVIDSGVASEDRPPFLLDVLYDDGSSRTFTIGPFRRGPDWGTTAFAPGFDAIVDLGFAWDDEGHGTHVASTIAESGNNGVGLTGLAFGVTLLPIKACLSLPWIDPELVGCPSFAIAEGIDYARTRGAEVINLSLGGAGVSEAERNAVTRAAAANIVLVAAAGNEDGPVDYPAAFESVIAVGAVGGRRSKTFYSSFGPELDLVAPGGDPFDDADGNGIPDFVFQRGLSLRAAAAGDYTQFGNVALAGTSMASPHVAAAAALLISQGITDAKAVRRALEQTADDLGAAGRDDLYGHGLINLPKALSGLGLNR